MKSCLLSKQELSFVRTSCQILGIDGLSMVKTIQREVEDKGLKQPRKVMECVQARLKELADRVEKHKRPTPNPAGSTRTTNSMGAPVRSLANLVGCVEALKEAVGEQYSKGIRAAMKAMENAKVDYKNAIDRLAMASRWRPETTDDWVRRGRQHAEICWRGQERLSRRLKRGRRRKQKSGSWKLTVRS